MKTSINFVTSQTRPSSQTDVVAHFSCKLYTSTIDLEQEKTPERPGRTAGRRRKTRWGLVKSTTLLSLPNIWLLLIKTFRPTLQSRPSGRVISSLTPPPLPLPHRYQIWIPIISHVVVTNFNLNYRLKSLFIMKIGENDLSLISMTL